MTNEIKKILIIRFSSIGDIVLCSPIIRCTKKTYPQAEIHFITKKEYASLVEKNPSISKTYLIDEKDVKPHIPSLQKENYDLIIDLHKNLRSLRLKSQLRGKKLTFNKLNFRKLLYCRLKINTLPKRHLVDRYFDALKKQQIFNDNKGLDFFLPETISVNLPTENYIAIVIGAKFATKQMPAELIAEIISKTTKDCILLGGNTDISLANEIMQLAKTKRLHNLCGKLDLFASAYILKKAAVVLTNDTGLMHIAAAFSKKIVSVWGNTVADFGMYPYMPNKEEGKDYFIVEVKNLGCRPCSKIGYKKCPKKHFHCMKQQNPTEIAALLND